MKIESSNLDILRAVAVLAVVVSHALILTTPNPAPDALFNLGHVGVLIFFVHTSYVLMLSLERQSQKAPDRLWSRFMIRRVFRIYPLSIVGVFVTVGFSI